MVMLCRIARDVETVLWTPGMCVNQREVPAAVLWLHEISVFLDAE